MKNLFALLCACIIMQGHVTAQKIISGKVLDEAGQGLPTASVLIENSKLGAVTDFDGNFTITGLTSGKYILKVNFVGYNTGTQQVDLIAKDSAYVEVRLKPSSLSIDAVVVTGTKHSQKLSEQSVSVEVVQSHNLSSQSINNVSGVTMRGGRGKAAKNNYGYYAPAVDLAAIPDAIDFPDDTVGNNNFRKVIKNPFSTFSIDVDDGSYTYMRKNVNGGTLPDKDEVRIEEFINYFEYDYPLPETRETPFRVYTEMSACPWNPSHKLLHVGIKGYDVLQSALPPSNLVFLLDVSGSMSSYDKLPLVKKAFGYMIDELTEKDLVSIVVYAGSSGLVLPPTKGNNKQAIKDALDKLYAGGSTAGGAGIELAYKTAKDNFIKEGNNRVILTTDGDFNVGISDENGLVKLIEQKRDDGIFLSVIGCGTGNYQDKKMEQLADHGNGYYGYIDDEAEAKRIFAKQMGATILTIAKDVKLQVEFNAKWVKEYKLVGYENRQLKDEEFTDDKKDAGELGAGSSVTALYELVLYDQPNHNAKIDERNNKLTYASFGETDIAALNIRYKEPQGSKSQLITQMMQDNSITPDKTSNDFRFSAAVAMAGMVLKKAENKGNASYDMAYAMASAAKGKDNDGYRKEFTDLLDKIRKTKK
jgi:Ca-activated chloride channel family protein